MTHDDSTSDQAPAICVGPEPSPQLEAAVVAGGGRPAALADAVGLVVHGGDPDQLRAMLHPGIAWVQLPSAGIESWAAAGLITRHPVWTSAAGAYGPQVAEHALALLLAGVRRLTERARATSWDQEPSGVLRGSRVALVGYGGIGRELHRALAALDCSVLAVSDSGPVEGAERTYPRADYREALSEADHVVLLAPLTPATRGMIAARELASMRPGAWLVNVGRGGLVVTDDLVDALRAGRIGGAALDVTDPEPLPDGHPLWTLPTALITPHAANPPEVHDAALADRVEENVRRWRSGHDLLAVVDPDQGF